MVQHICIQILIRSSEHLPMIRIQGVLSVALFVVVVDGLFSGVVVVMSDDERLAKGGSSLTQLA